MSLSHARNLLPLFAAATIVASGWMSVQAGNDNPTTSQPATQRKSKDSSNAQSGRVVVDSYTKVDTTIESERKFLEQLPVSASNGRVAVMIYVPASLSLFDKQLLLAVKAAATEYATETGRTVPMILMPDNDADPDTVSIHVWAGGNAIEGIKSTKDKKQKSDAMTPDSYHGIRKNTLQLMRTGWNRYQQTLLSRVDSSASQVASLRPDQ